MSVAPLPAEPIDGVSGGAGRHRVAGRVHGGNAMGVAALDPSYGNRDGNRGGNRDGNRDGNRGELPALDARCPNH